MKSNESFDQTPPKECLSAQEAADFLLPLNEPVRHSCKMIGGAETGQAGADNDDHAAFLPSVESGRVRTVLGRATSIFLNRAVTTSNNPIVPTHKVQAAV